MQQGLIAGLVAITVTGAAIASGTALSSTYGEITCFVQTFEACPSDGSSETEVAEAETEEETSSSAPAATAAPAPSATAAPASSVTATKTSHKVAGYTLKPGAKLAGSSFMSKKFPKGVDLTGADMRGSYIYKTKLRGADMTGVDVSGSYLYKTSFKGVDLTGADLSGTAFGSFKGATIKDTICPDGKKRSGSC